MKRVGFFYCEEKNNDCRRQRMMKVLIVIMMAGMWCMQPEKASAADPVIRVLLTTTDFNSRYHQEITVSYDGKEIRYTAEEVKKHSCTKRWNQDSVHTKAVRNSGLRRKY